MVRLDSSQKQWALSKIGLARVAGIALALHLSMGCATSVRERSHRLADLFPPEDPSATHPFLSDSADMPEDIPKNLRWWLSYKRAQSSAKTSPREACKLHEILSQDPEFPLRLVSRMRSVTLCPHPIEFNFEDTEFWLRRWALDAALLQARAQAKDFLSNQRLLKILLVKLKETSGREDRIKIVTESLALASSLRIQEGPQIQPVVPTDQISLEETIASLNERLVELAPRLKLNPAETDYIEIANDYRRARQFEAAHKYYGLALKSPKLEFEEKLNALKGIRQTHRLQRNDDAHLRATKNLATFAKAHYLKEPKNKIFAENFLSTAILYARTLWTQDQSSEARKLLLSLAEKPPRGVGLSQVFWILGRMHEEKQEFAQATDWFRKVLAANPEESLRYSSLWYIAWNYRKLGDPVSAVSVLQQLVDGGINSGELNKHRFWLARTQSELGMVEESKNSYQTLILEDPISYYGLLAQREMGSEEMVQLAKKSSVFLDSRDVPLDINPFYSALTAEWLKAVDENEFLKSYLDQATEVYRKKENQSVEGWRFLLRQYGRVGSFLSISQTMGRMDSGLRRSIIESDPKILYPQPFQAEVLEAAERFKVSPSLINAIIRQESAFDPRARSPMDAFGLMQLLPEIAKKKARRNAIPYSGFQDLFIPRTNVLLGSSLIQHLIQTQKGQWVLAVASYNASEKAIRGWINTRYRGNTFEFIEDIPYDETRGYVKAVMRNYFFYSLLEVPFQMPSLAPWLLTSDTTKLASPNKSVIESGPSRLEASEMNKIESEENRNPLRSKIQPILTTDDL